MARRGDGVPGRTDVIMGGCAYGHRHGAGGAAVDWSMRETGPSAMACGTGGQHGWVAFRDRSAAPIGLWQGRWAP